MCGFYSAGEGLSVDTCHVKPLLVVSSTAKDPKDKERPKFLVPCVLGGKSKKKGGRAAAFSNNWQRLRPDLVSLPARFPGAHPAPVSAPVVRRRRRAGQKWASPEAPCRR